MPFSLSVILEPGVRAVEAEAAATVDIDGVLAPKTADLFELADKDDEAEEEEDPVLMCCPVTVTKAGTFKVVVVAEPSISTESMLSEEDEEPKPNTLPEELLAMTGAVIGTLPAKLFVCFLTKELHEINKTWNSLKTK